MEVSKLSSDANASRKLMEATMVQTLLAAQMSLAHFLMLSGSLLGNVDGLLNLAGKRFPMDELHRLEKPGPENKDGRWWLIQPRPWPQHIWRAGIESRAGSDRQGVLCLGWDHFGNV
ncbi:Uncharacterized protein Fot_52395 [Forsythia ovata]|uniref:Uncharacterized protein n=1 Tax=Forsythia ovata TaxID=205694 RepID=A0ABD1PN70_9LAMI